MWSAAWIGNTAAVAAKHYLQVTDADFDRAAGGGAESGAQVVQKPVQRAAAPIRMEGKKRRKPLHYKGLCPFVATGWRALDNLYRTLAGLEPATPGLEIPCSIRLSYRGKNSQVITLY